MGLGLGARARARARARVRLEALEQTLGQIWALCERGPTCWYGGVGRISRPERPVRKEVGCQVLPVWLRDSLPHLLDCGIVGYHLSHLAPLSGRQTSTSNNSAIPSSPISSAIFSTVAIDGVCAVTTTIPGHGTALGVTLVLIQKQDSSEPNEKLRMRIRQSREISI